MMKRSRNWETAGQSPAFTKEESFVNMTKAQKTKAHKCDPVILNTKQQSCCMPCRLFFQCDCSNLVLSIIKWKILAKISRKQADGFPLLKTMTGAAHRCQKNICVVNNPQCRSFNGTGPMTCGHWDGHNEYHCWESFPTFPLSSEWKAHPSPSFNLLVSICYMCWIPLKCKHFFLDGAAVPSAKNTSFLKLTVPSRKHQSVGAQWERKAIVFPTMLAMTTYLFVEMIRWSELQ